MVLSIEFYEAEYQKGRILHEKIKVQNRHHNYHPNIIIMQIEHFIIHISLYDWHHGANKTENATNRKYEFLAYSLFLITFI